MTYDDIMTFGEEISRYCALPEAGFIQAGRDDDGLMVAAGVRGGGGHSGDDSGGEGAALLNDLAGNMFVQLHGSSASVV